MRTITVKYELYSIAELNDKANFIDLMDRCLDEFSKNCRGDFSYCVSQELCEEESTRNEQEYQIDGSLINNKKQHHEN